MEKKFVILISLLFASFAVNAQFFQWNESALQHRVKQLDEFMKRFNYELDIAGKPIPADKRNDTEGRKKYIMSLFNKDLVLKAANQDSAFFEVEKFAEKVVFAQEPVYLNFTDTTWMAEAICSVIFNGKSEKLSIFLKTEKIAEGEYKWVISNVRGSMFDLTPVHKNPGIMISPVDNEISFMNLPDISGANRKDVINYSIKSFVHNRLSAFNTLIYNNLLVIDAVEKVVYHFNQVPDYIFSVEHFERSGANVGWLISNFGILDNEEKDRFNKTFEY